MHKDCRLYKYLWRVFWTGSPCEGEKFMRSTPLSTKAAFDLIEQIERNGNCCIISNERRRRLGIAMWNPESRRWKGKIYAPVYDDDPDPATAFGHK
jgi:hypothetical protein